MSSANKAYNSTMTVNNVLMDHGCTLTDEEIEKWYQYFLKRPWKSPWDIVHSELERRGKLLNSIKGKDSTYEVSP